MNLTDTEFGGEGPKLLRRTHKSKGGILLLEDRNHR